MTIAQIKALSWLLAALLTLALSGYVYAYISDLHERGNIDTGEIRAALEDVPQVEKQQDDLIDYEDVKRLFHEGRLNWTGQPPPERVDDTPAAAVQAQPRRVPVANLLRVLMIQHDPLEPANSAIFVLYTAAAQVPKAPIVEGYMLRVGDRLHGAHKAIRVAAIGEELVTFAFDEAGNDVETLGPEAFDPQTQIVTVGPDGVRYPQQRPIPVGTTPRAPPGETRRIGPNHFRIGLDDAEYINQNYTEIITSDLQPRRHRDARTGRWDGIEITEVPPGSIGARHGAESGDVIKSINGHPVTSVPEAISFAKNNADKFDRWEIVIERRGKEITITYESR
jgi:hypothetical protein